MDVSETSGTKSDSKNNLKDFSGDFDILKDVLKFVKKYVNENQETGEKNPIWLEEDGCRVRLVFPHTIAPLFDIIFQKKYSQNTTSCDTVFQPWFVGFFGEQQDKSLISDKIWDDLWKTDNELVKSLHENGRILLYYSSEVSKGGDWFNFVFFSGEQGILDWKSTACHERAVSVISPYYYEKVRIHMGELHLDDVNPFHARRTLFVDYSSFRTDGTCSRHLRKWNPDECDSARPLQSTS